MKALESRPALDDAAVRARRARALGIGRVAWRALLRGRQPRRRITGDALARRRVGGSVAPDDGNVVVGVRARRREACVVRGRAGDHPALGRQRVHRARERDDTDALRDLGRERRRSLGGRRPTGSLVDDAALRWHRMVCVRSRAAARSGDGDAHQPAGREDLDEITRKRALLVDAPCVRRNLLPRHPRDRLLELALFRREGKIHDEKLPCRAGPAHSAWANTGRSRSAVTVSSSGSTRVSPTTVMKFVSPFQRGTR